MSLPLPGAELAKCVSGAACVHGACAGTERSSGCPCKWRTHAWAGRRALRQRSPGGACWELQGPADAAGPRGIADKQLHEGALPAPRRPCIKRNRRRAAARTLQSRWKFMKRHAATTVALLPRLRTRRARRQSHSRVRQPVHGRHLWWPLPRTTSKCMAARRRGRRLSLRCPDVAV